MVKLKPSRVDYKNHNTPVLFDWEIETYAHAVIEDYKPHLLREPNAINFQHFLESYLGATIEYHDIYSDDPERPILAMTIYSRGNIKVFDRENKCINSIEVPKRTVVVDNVIMESGKEGLARFSGLHEGGHLAMHWDVYSNIIAEAAETGEAFPTAVYYRRDNIERVFNRKATRSAEEWREYQADCFAAAIAMPTVTFKPFVHNLLRENGYYKATITIGRDSDLDILADDILPDAISEVYGVSKKAARIKLRKLGFVMGSSR